MPIWQNEEVATYVVGDIHGCFETFRALLSRIRFDEREDRLWLVGDLVNRGANSLEVLRWAKHRDRILTVVLGNHDLHLLARHLGVVEERSGDTLEPVLAAWDREQLIHWLRFRPLVHSSKGRVVVHAGVLPTWSAGELVKRAREAEAHLQDDRAALLLCRSEENGQPAGTAAARHALQLLTRLRCCRKDGKPCFGYGGPPGKAPQGCRPWFTYRAITKGEKTFYFGHWAQLGFRRSKTAVCLDSGCVYGGSLTAVRVEDGRAFQEKNRE